jgi:hypothetical protein
MTSFPPWRVHLLALATYIAVALLFFVSALPTLGTAFPGGPVAGVDGWQHVWHLWWVSSALSRGVSPFQTPLLYYPSGINLAIHPLNLTTGLLAAPATALAGPVSAFNLALLAAFALSGFGAYLLALRAGASPGAAFVAGLLFTCSPFHTTKAYDGQLEMASLQWLALYAWLLLTALSAASTTIEPALERCERREPQISVPQWLNCLAQCYRSWRLALLAGLMLAVVGYASLYYLVYGAVYSLLVALIWLPWRSDRRAVAGYLLRLLLVPTVAILALAPLLLRLGAALAEVSGVGGGPDSAPSLLGARSANLVDFWLPSYLHPLWGPAVARLGPLLHPDVSAWNSALGYTALILAGVGCIVAWPKAWRWLVVALTGLLLALGPELLVGPIHTGIPLPYQLLLLLPGMDVAQRPGHFVVLTCLALVPLAGLGLSHLATRYGRPAIAIAIAAAAIELAPPAWPLQRFTVDLVYTQLAATPGALLVLPVEIDRSDVLRDQIVHGRPLVGGYLARTPPYPFADLTPGIRQLWRLSPDQETFASPVGASPAEVLDAFDVRDVVVRWPAIPAAKRDAAHQALAQVLPGLSPAIQSDDLAVYHVPVGARRPFAYIGVGWYPEEHAAERRWRWMGQVGELLLVNPTGAPASVVLHLRAESYAAPRPVTLSLNGTNVGTWTVSAQPVSASISLRLLLAPGLSRLSLAAPGAADPGGRGPISIVLSDIQIETP